MASIKKLGERQLELEDECACGAKTKYIIVSREGEFHVERVVIEESHDEEEEFWTGKKGGRR